MAPTVRTGLDRLAAGEGPSLRGTAVALLCHPASVDARLRHAIEVVRGAGAQLTALWGPEHGVDAAAQDMEHVPDGALVAAPPLAKTPGVVPTYSLYGEHESSLVPRVEQLHGARLLIADLQDVGARYYTYVWTIVLAAEVALRAGVEVWILDRPNPLGGTDDQVEGGAIDPGFTSFVGLHDVATRHGLTIAELAHLALAERGQADLAGLHVLECQGWRREQGFAATGLPWVLPSPNMPTLDTALVYPGQCLLEGTALSEGRGTTRPFELCGAPWVDGPALAAAIAAEDLPGLRLRATAFKPMFQKHAGVRCGGVQLHVDAPEQVRSLRSTWALLAALWTQSEGRMAWRTEPYEFVADRLAIDLLAGGTWLREAVEAGVPARELVARVEPARQAYLARRRPFLRYA
jgi:uncharacterized protein YbbC (DUF1343 family)